MKIEELVAQVKQSTYPDLNVDIDRYLLEFATRFLAAYTEQQEPVAIVVGDPKGSFGALLIGLPAGTDLYAAPVVPADRIADLERQVAAEKERADYAWRNTNTIEKARQEEMARRDALTTQVAALTKERDMWRDTDLRDASRIDELAAQLAAVVQQRDELLVALKKMLCCDVAEVRTIPESIGALQAARAAIAKVQP